MRDCQGNAYEVLRRASNDKKGWRHNLVLLLSPARQTKKASGLSGRQWVRSRKRARRAQRAAAVVAR